MVTPPKETTIVIEDFPSHAPSVCFMCEACEQGAKFLRTGRVFEAGPFNPLSGIKYVCSNCVRDFASAFGMFDEAAEKVVAIETTHQLRIAELEEELAAYASFKSFLGKFAPDVQVEPVKTPKKKAAAV